MVSVWFVYGYYMLVCSFLRFPWQAVFCRPRRFTGYYILNHGRQTLQFVFSLSVEKGIAMHVHARQTID